MADTQLGRFSVSLSVKDIATSKAFYEKLGFTPVPNCGSIEEKWLILSHGEINLGLFQDMFPKNTLTFNPDPSVEDIRSIHSKLKGEGLEFTMENLPGESGPAHFAMLDPDGNPILIDQHS